MKLAKLIFKTLFIIFFFLPSFVNADEYQPYVEGQFVENSISIGSGKYNIPLPKGKFVIIATHKYREKSSNSIQMYEIGMATFKGKILDKYVYIKFSKPISTWWNLPKDCNRENVYFFKKYIRGHAFSCWFVNHNTMQLTSNKIKKDSYVGKVKDYVLTNKIIIPNICIYSQHLYSSPRHKNVFFLIRYYENPELSGVPKAEARNWDQSEYQPARIIQYPKKQAFMENYIIKSANYQKNFEDSIGMLPEHRLDTSMAFKKQALENPKPKSNMVNELSDLNKLYKSGALSKEEFEKAKKQILSK